MFTSLLYANISVKSRRKSKKVKIFFGQFEGRIQAVSGQFGCPVFCYHKGKTMRCAMYDRLLAIGYTEQMAMDILRLFPDPEELRTYVYFAELFHV